MESPVLSFAPCIAHLNEHVLPVPSTQSTVFVQSYGDPSSPALILTHGFLQTSACWRRVVDALARSFYVITWDLPGHGFSGPAEGLLTFSLLAEGLHAIVTHYDLQARGFALVAWSFGGMVSREYLIRYGSQGLTHLVLVAAPTDLMEMQLGNNEPDDWLLGLSSHITLTRDAAFTKFIARLSAQPQTMSEYYETLGYNAHTLLRMEATPLDLSSYTATDDAVFQKNIPVPVLLIYGCQDALIPATYIEAQLAHFPATCQVQSYPDCGHSPHLEDPRRFVADLEMFLQATPTGILMPPHPHAAPSPQAISA